VLSVLVLENCCLFGKVDDVTGDEMVNGDEGVELRAKLLVIFVFTVLQIPPYNIYMYCRWSIAVV
jgi:hypothetical protein